MLVTSLDVTAKEFEAGTGWQLKPEGACKGHTCIPLPQRPGERVNIPAMAEALGMPLVAEPELGIWALGPESLGSRALTTAAAPELTLPDVDGNSFSLSSLKGQKIIVYAWAPY